MDGIDWSRCRIDWVVGHLGGHWIRDIASRRGLVFTSPRGCNSAGRKGHQSIRVLHLGSNNECCVLERQ
jgi:hypothetical protein